jgi:putative membrane protein
MMWSGWGWRFGGLWWIMPIVMVVVWGLIIWGIVMLVRRGSSGCCGASHSTTESTLDILKRRYASGEINKEEFAQKRRDLGS